MINSIELQMISKILTSQDDQEVEKLCSYDKSYYSILNSQIQFILEHKEKTGKVPDVFTFQAKFEDFTIVQVNEPLSYLESEIKKNKQHKLFIQTYNKLADLGSDDVTEAWEYLKRQCEIASSLDTYTPVDIVGEAQERAEKILEYNKRERIPTGFKEIDSVMYGGLSTVEELLVIVARTNAGKAQPLWSKVLTPNGWTTMGDLKIGDVVVGKNNDNGHVIEIFPQGIIDYYRVTFDDGTYTECCDDHLWEVLDSKRRMRDCNEYGEFEVLTTRDIRNSIEKNYSVDLCGEVEFDSVFDEDNELDGYLLGVILGDGGLRDGRVCISNESDEIWSYIEEIIKRYNCHRSGKYQNSIKGYERNCNFVRNKIKEYGLLNIKSIDKFIPKQYLTAPVHVRKALLAGLLDTDGYAHANSPTFEFDTSSEQLAYDFCELARSLGVYVKLHNRQPSYYTRNGIKHQAKGSRHIICRSEFNPFRYSKKASKYSYRREIYHRSALRRNCKKIKSIEYAGKTECQCILLDNQTHTYVTDDYIVTHNSWVCSKMMESAQKSGFSVLYYSPEMQSSFIGTRFDTWRGHFKNSELHRGIYTEEYYEYLRNLETEEAKAVVVEDHDMSEGKVTVSGLEALVKRYHSKLLVIDGLSYITTNSRFSNESLKYKEICNDLFKLSKNYGCAVVVAVQANRESRENRDENGEVFPNIYNISESDHPARIATQVFALRQLYEQHILEFRLEKSRNAKNTKTVFAYAIDFNSGSLEFVSSQNQNSSGETTTADSFRTPIVSAQIQTHIQAEPELDEDDFDDEGITF